MKTLRVNQVADRLGKHPATVWRWIARGCDIDSEDSIQQFLSGKKRRRNLNTVRKPKKRNTSAAPVANPQESQHEPEPEPEPEPELDAIELAPVGRRGAAAALARLEEIEERAHARLMRAIESGNQFQVKACQEFYLRSSETLRRLDLAVETERRTTLEQIPLRQIEDVSRQISEWLRISFAQFLNAESPGLMGINDLGEFKFSAIEWFRGILHATVKASLRSDPPMPDWAAAKVVEAWNVPWLLTNAYGGCPPEKPFDNKLAAELSKEGVKNA